MFRLRPVIPIDFSLVRQSLDVLPVQFRYRFGVIVLLQILAALLDVAGVAVFALALVILSSQISGIAAPDSVSNVLAMLGIPEAVLAEANASIVLLLLSALFLTAKPIVVLIILRYTIRTFASAATEASTGLHSRLFKVPYLHASVVPTSEVTYGLGGASNAAIVGVLASASTVASELVVIAGVSLAVFVLDPTTAIFAAAYFSLWLIVLHVVVGGRAAAAARRTADADVALIRLLHEEVSSAAEIRVLGRSASFHKTFSSIRDQMGRAASQTSFLQGMPKYVYEIVLVLGAILLAVVTSSGESTLESLAVLATFVVAASRIMPSALRIQSQLATLRASAAGGEPFFALLNHLRSVRVESESPPTTSEVTCLLPESNSSTVVRLESVSFCYPTKTSPALKNVSFEVKRGSTFAIVGESGSGKSTLAGVIVGLLSPTSGVLQVCTEPCPAFGQWPPRRIAYVPQAVGLLDSTIRDNILFGLPSCQVADSEIWECLEQVGLAEYLRNSRSGLDTPVGERGLELSGGQVQRMGIARALLGKPEILVMDEATSALDSISETKIGEAIRRMHGSVTTILVAHRLPTVVNADQIVYLEAGQVAALGKFEELKRVSPRFAEQARLMGL